MKNFVLLALTFCLLACKEEATLLKMQGKIFGTYYSLVLHGKEVDKEKLNKEVDQFLRGLDYIFSTYKEDSELSRLNKLDSIERVGLSGELFNVLNISQNIFKETNGYFDVTVGPIVNAWGFGPDGVQNKPSDEEIKKLSQFVGMDKIELFKNGDIKKSNSNIYIDLSAIAKGYAVDQLLLYLEQKGFKGGLVEIGGEVRTFGTKPKGETFKVGIEKPEFNQSGNLINVVELKDMAMATSGSYRNFKKYQDKFFSHTIDPIAKKPANNNMISVTVLHNNCTFADAYATAFMVMGAEKSLEFANNKGLGIYILVKNGENIDILTSDYFPKKGQK